MRESFPGILSLSRIPCAILLIALYSDRERWRFEAAIAVVLIALLTDFLDGAIARRFRLESKLGYILDGLGDRAMYIGLFLTFLVQKRIGVVVTWLLIFREVAIYATRLFSDQWFEANKAVRPMSMLHAGLIRTWILSMLIRDGAVLYTGTTYFSGHDIAVAQATLLLMALCASYYSLLRHLLAILRTIDL